MRILHFCFLFLIFPALPAFAYLDPGTGSIIVSAIIGAVATVVYVFKGWFFKLFGMLKKSKKIEDRKEASKE